MIALTLAPNHRNLTGNMRDIFRLKFLATFSFRSLQVQLCSRYTIFKADYFRLQKIYFSLDDKCTYLSLLRKLVFIKHKQEPSGKW